MSARGQTCDPSKYRRHQDGGVSKHQWELVGQDNPHGQCRLFDYKCQLCGAKKWISFNPDEPFDIAEHWEADE